MSERKINENEIKKLKENLETLSEEDFEIVVKALECGGFLLQEFEKTRELVFYELADALKLSPPHSWEYQTARAIINNNLTLIRKAISGEEELPPSLEEISEEVHRYRKEKKKKSRE